MTLMQLLSMHAVIRETLPDVYIHNVMIGDDIGMDRANSIFMKANDQVFFRIAIIINVIFTTISQVATVCEKIKNDPNLASGYNAIGNSQAGQFLRGVAQRCPDPPMKNLITMGSQHQVHGRILVWLVIQEKVLCRAFMEWDEDAQAHTEQESLRDSVTSLENFLHWEFMFPGFKVSLLMTGLGVEGGSEVNPNGAYQIKDAGEKILCPITFFRKESEI